MKKVVYTLLASILCINLLSAQKSDPKLDDKNNSSDENHWILGFGLNAVDNSDAKFEDLLVDLLSSPKAKKVITTLRGSLSASHNTWAGVLYDGSTMCESPQYQITHIVDRVGGGDSFMGGLIYGLITFPDDDQQALNFAVAASCLKHTIKGDANLVSVEEVKKLMSGDSSGRVAR